MGEWDDGENGCGVVDWILPPFLTQHQQDVAHTIFKNGHEHNGDGTTIVII